MAYLVSRKNAGPAAAVTACAATVLSLLVSPRSWDQQNGSEHSFTANPVTIFRKNISCQEGYQECLRKHIYSEAPLRYGPQDRDLYIQEELLVACQPFLEQCPYDATDERRERIDQSNELMTAIVLQSAWKIGLVTRCNPRAPENAGIHIRLTSEEYQKKLGPLIERWSEDFPHRTDLKCDLDDILDRCEHSKRADRLLSAETGILAQVHQAERLRNRLVVFDGQQGLQDLLGAYMVSLHERLQQEVWDLCLDVVSKRAKAQCATFR